jgi:glycosyltransferase involved in cell wall biosynthesis
LTDLLMTSTTTAPRASLVPPVERTAPPPRVLYAIVLDPSKKFGSLEEQLFFLAQEFRARGSLFLPLFDCVLEPGFEVPEFRDAGLATACLDLRRFRWSTLRRLLGLIRRERIDVVHWNFFSPLGNAYLWWLSLLAPTVRHYFTDHNSRYLPLKKAPRLPVRLVKRLLLRCYRKVLCVSRFVQDCLASLRTWRNLVTCLHFINTDRFRPDPAVRRELRARLDLEGRFVVLFVGQLIDEKGVDLLLEAMRELPENVVLWVAGDGARGDRYREQCQEWGLAERVRFLGLVSRVQPYMQAADCLACPSDWAEAAGLVTLEAQACGLPVVASRIGGLPEYVCDQETGLLFPPRDRPALVHCLRRLRDEPALCRALGEQARERMVEFFSVQARLGDYLAIYS